VPEVVLNGGLPDLQRLRGEAFLQRMRTEGAEQNRRGAEKRAGRQERFQAAFGAFFFGLCGRFLP
jgi:hypothetical protein